jgi:hypothetical protein
MQKIKKGSWDIMQAHGNDTNHPVDNRTGVNPWRDGERGRGRDYDRDRFAKSMEPLRLEK